MVPEIRPVAGLIARPGGKPVADQVRTSPSRSVAGADSVTATPSLSARFTRSPSKVGGRLVSATVQLKVVVSLRPPPSSTRTATR